MDAKHQFKIERLASPMAAFEVERTDQGQKVTPRNELVKALGYALRARFPSFSTELEFHVRK